MEVLNNLYNKINYNIRWWLIKKLIGKHGVACNLYLKKSIMIDASEQKEPITFWGCTHTSYEGE